MNRGPSVPLPLVLISHVLTLPLLLCNHSQQSCHQYAHKNHHHTLVLRKMFNFALGPPKLFYMLSPVDNTYSYFFHGLYWTRWDSPNFAHQIEVKYKGSNGVGQERMLSNSSSPNSTLHSAFTFQKNLLHSKCIDLEPTMLLKSFHTKHLAKEKGLNVKI